MDAIPPSEISVTTATGRSMEYRISQRLSLVDGVLLRPVQSMSGTRPLPIASEPVAPGEFVAVVGYPQNDITFDELLVTFGIVAGSAQWGVGVTAPVYHVLNAFTSPGGSGSAVVNLEGEVVGMVTHGGTLDAATGFVDSFSYAVNFAGQTVP